MEKDITEQEYIERQNARIEELEQNLTYALCHANKCVSERDHFLDLLTVARNHLKTIKYTECDAYKVAGMGLIKTRHCNCSEHEQQCCDMCTGWDDATLKGKTHLKDKE